VDSGPVPDVGDQSFLDSVGKEVAETLDLGRFFVADQDGLIAARPDAMRPVEESCYLAGEVGVYVLHETSELVGVVDGEQEVEVLDRKTAQWQTMPNLRLVARPRTPAMIWFKAGLGRRRKRDWKVRTVTSTREPLSGMNRMCLMPC
jgi:hypothetical protein